MFEQVFSRKFCLSIKKRDLETKVVALSEFSFHNKEAEDMRKYKTSTIPSI